MKDDKKKLNLILSSPELHLVFRRYICASIYHTQDSPALLQIAIIYMHSVEAYRGIYPRSLPQSPPPLRQLLRGNDGRNSYGYYTNFRIFERGRGEGGGAPKGHGYEE